MSVPTANWRGIYCDSIVPEHYDGGSERERQMLEVPVPASMPTIVELHAATGKLLAGRPVIMIRRWVLVRRRSIVLATRRRPLRRVPVITVRRRSVIIVRKRLIVPVLYTERAVMGTGTGLVGEPSRRRWGVRPWDRI